MSDQLIPMDSGMSAVAMMSDDAMFNRMVKFADIMASGRATIPKELQNPGDCMAITMQAMTWKMNPFSLAQKVHFISGKIGYEAQAVAAAVENSGAIIGGFDFEWFGPWEKVVGKFEIRTNAEKKEYRVPGWSLKDEEGIGIKVWATKKGESEPRIFELLLAQARTRNSTMWADDPKMQLAYLAEKKWSRLYTPGVLLGVYTPDELEQIVPGEKDVTPQPEAEKTVQFVTDADFAANRKKWKDSVEGGRKTKEALIAWIESKDARLTEGQLTEISTWKKKDVIEGESKVVDDPFVDALNAAEAQTTQTGETA